MGSHIFPPTQAGNDVVGSFGPWLRDAFISVVHFVLVSFFQLLPAETDPQGSVFGLTMLHGRP